MDDYFLRALGTCCKDLNSKNRIASSCIVLYLKTQHYIIVPVVLGIENCQDVTDEGLSDCIRGIDNMHFLSADRCGSIGAKVMQSLAEKHTNLVDLFVNKCSFIDNDSLIIVAKSCSKVLTTVTCISSKLIKLS